MESAGAAGDLATFLEHDIAYHRLLLETSGNAMFAGRESEVARAAMTAICVEVADGMDQPGGNGAPVS